MLRTLFVFTTLLFLNACGTMEKSSNPYASSNPYGRNVIPSNAATFPVANGDGMQNQTPVLNSSTIAPVATNKIALLLPLTGPQAAIGQSMLNASQMALFDMNDPRFEILSFDTQGTTAGASNAVRQAAEKGAKLITGPLLADNVQAAGATARQYGLQVVGFTTDSTKIGNNVMTLGILPFDQGRRMAQYARTANLGRIVIIDPQTQYSNAIIQSFEQTTRQNGLRIADKIKYGSPSTADRIAKALEARQTQFDAIFIPVGNPTLAALAQALTNNGLSAQVKPWLGAGLWDDQSIQSNRAMQGALYAAPAPQQRMNFERQYQSTFGETPQRLASLAYDATALSVVLLRQNTQLIDKNSLLNPNGFTGIDGIFRFDNNGMAERGLAIHRISDGGRTIITDQAPSSFATASR